MKGAALLAVTLAAACSKEERVEHGTIDFIDPKVVKTKSSTLIDDVSMESFSVFATMSNDDDADLDTDGIQSSYWFHGAEHEFYAVYPSDDPNLVYSYENGKVKLTGALSTDGTTYNPIFTGTNISWDDTIGAFAFKIQEQHGKGPMDREWYIYEAIPVEQ